MSAAPTAPTGDAAPADPPAGTTEPAPQIEAKPGYDSESYAWPEESSEPAPSAAPAPAPTPEPATPPAQTPAPSPSPAPASAPEPAPTDETAALAAIVQKAVKGEELSKDELATLRKNPSIAKNIDDAAASRFGNLKQQEEQRQREQAKADEDWASSERDYAEYTRLGASADAKDRAEYARYSADPNVQRWLSWHHAEAARRATAAAAPQTQPDALTEDRMRELVGQQINDWNVEGARSLGSALKAHLPFYDQLSADFRRDLEAASAQTDAPWTEEYAQRLAKDFDRIVREREESAKEAGRNEVRANNARNGPQPMAAPPMSTPEEEMDDAQVLARHADWGFNKADDGISVTPEQLERAKRNRGWS